jgi:hypothetical protein
MSSHEESPFAQIANCIDSIRSRQSNQGTYFGDGPTSEKLDELEMALKPIADYPDSVECSEIWSAFRVSTETEMSWIFPERDPISSGMISALCEVQRITGEALVAVDPDWQARLEKFSSLHIVENAATRQTALHGNRISLGLVAARILNRLGAKHLAESIADRVVTNWQR